MGGERKHAWRSKSALIWRVPVSEVCKDRGDWEKTYPPPATTNISPFRVQEMRAS